MPYVAAMYALNHFAKTFFMDFVEVRVGIMLNDNSERQVMTRLVVIVTLTLTLFSSQLRFMWSV